MAVSDDEIAEVLTELCLDDEPETRSLLTNLYEQAQILVVDSVSSTLTPDYFKDNPLFKRAVITLVTQLYYERTLPNGFSKGLIGLIDHLKGYVKDD